MKISSLHMHPLHIPFRETFRHAGAERARTETIIVRAHNGQMEGIGEGCPRSYVTGESPDTATAFFTQYKHAIMQLSSLDDIRAFRHQETKAIDSNPAAWCAVELALLDLLGKEEHRPLEAILDVSPIERPHHYSAILSAGSAEGFARQLAQYQAQGFTQFKIKLSGDIARDTAYVDCLRIAGIAPAHVRADANRLWVDAEAALHHLTILDYPFHAIEDPLHTFDVPGLLHIAKHSHSRIILDEYFLRADQFRLLPESGPWIVNLRVSKMGGLLRSLDVIQHARHARTPLIVGAQVGETSILTRAGLCAASACHDLLLAQEGAFGNLLLMNDPCTPTLTFGYGGRLPYISAFHTYGLGLVFSEGNDNKEGSHP